MHGYFHEIFIFWKNENLGYQFPTNSHPGILYHFGNAGQDDDLGKINLKIS